MANEEHLAILKQGVKVWNEWKKNNYAAKIDFSGVDLIGVNLLGINLDGVKFTGANLSNASFRGAKLREVDLRDTILNIADLRADLRWADLSRARLHRANLCGANLDWARLSETDLTEADLRDAQVGGTSFDNIDLGQVYGLDKVRHSLPSTVGIDTIYKSKGNIPEVFLRGCGVPEDMIAYARSLRGRAIEFYSCFISHSAKDKRFCERLYADLQAKGVRVWYFPEDAKWGETVWGEIDRSIKVYDKLIVVCSENSLASGPVNREIERALIREDKEGKGILFPIRIDDYIFDHWEHERKADVVAKVVGDFSGWGKDAAKYDKAFDKLLKGLQAV